MSEYLVTWRSDGEEAQEGFTEEGLALARIVQLHSDAKPATLYQLVPVKLNVSARIIKRRKGTPAPAKEATPPPLPGAGGSSPEKQAVQEGVRDLARALCPAPECLNVEPCLFHGDVDKSIRREWLKARKAAERSAAGPLKESR